MGECTLEHCKDIGQFRYSSCISVFEYCHYSMFSLYSVCILCWLLLSFLSSSSLVPSQIRHRVHSRVILFSSFTTTSCTLSNLFSWRKRQRVETREKICLFSLLDLNSRANRTFWVIFAFAFTQFILVNVYYFFGWK